MHIAMRPGIVQPLAHEGQENIFLMDRLSHNCRALGFFAAVSEALNASYPL